ncbi:MAG: LPXTG cell wall anchor domain-containing protein [Anaerolineales bacterium]|jgi:LPXTG-motif cell wall-anchored protein
MSDMNNDELFEGFDEEAIIGGEPEEKRKPSNRNFLIAIGVIGAIFLIALIGLAVFAAVVLPQRSAQRQQEAAEINARNTATALAATQIAFAQQELLTPSPTAIPTNTPLPSPTPVVINATATPILAETSTPAAQGAAGTPAAAGPASDLLARTQTVAALLTQAAGGFGTAVATFGPTQLPQTGFMDEVGLPSMIGIAVLLIVVIVVARRLRLSST